MSRSTARDIAGPFFYHLTSRTSRSSCCQDSLDLGRLTADCAEFRPSRQPPFDLNALPRRTGPTSKVSAPRQSRSARSSPTFQLRSTGAAHADAWIFRHPERADEIRTDAVPGRRRRSGESVVTTRLPQAFSNCRNAVEACASASVAAVVAIRSEIDAPLKLSRITVTDNGPGIPAASRERVFQPFFTSKRNGTGLGLALVQKIIVFHNGRVVAGTSPAGGASLQVTLPLA